MRLGWSGLFSESYQSVIISLSVPIDIELCSAPQTTAAGLSITNLPFFSGSGAIVRLGMG